MKKENDINHQIGKPLGSLFELSTEVDRYGELPTEVDRYGEYDIVLFDGVCNLCNGVVQFIIKRDHKSIFRFASLQSNIGRQLLAEHNLSIDEINTIVFIKEKQAFTHSTAALKIGAQLGIFWIWTQLLWIFPKIFRDLVYNWIAKNRYHWFGKKESCMIPRPEWKDRFLS